MVSVEVGDEDMFEFQVAHSRLHQSLLDAFRGVEEEPVSSKREGHTGEVSLRRGGGAGCSEEGELDGHTSGGVPMFLKAKIWDLAFLYKNRAPP